LVLGSQDFDDYPEIKTRIAGIETTWPAALINHARCEKCCIDRAKDCQCKRKSFAGINIGKCEKSMIKKDCAGSVDYDAKRGKDGIGSKCRTR
jgi:hypothetical protein